MVEKRHSLYQSHKLVDSLAGHAVGEYKRFARAHQFGVVVHDLERRVHIGCEVGLVDYEYVALRNAGAVLARNLVAPSRRSRR